MSHLTRRSVLATVLVAGSSAWMSNAFAQGGKPPGRMQSWSLKTPRPTGIHDLAPAPDGGRTDSAAWITDSGLNATYCGRPGNPAPS